MRINRFSVDIDTDSKEEVLRRIALQGQLRVYAEQLIEATESRGNPREQGQLYYEIGLLLADMNRLDDAGVYFRAAANAFSSLGSLGQEAQAWLQVGKVEAHFGSLRAEETFERSRRAAKAANNTLIQAKALHQMGRYKELSASSDAEVQSVLEDYSAALSLLDPIAAQTDEAIATLRCYILEAISNLQLEGLLQKTKGLAKRTNSDAQRPALPKRQRPNDDSEDDSEDGPEDRQRPDDGPEEVPDETPDEMPDDIPVESPFPQEPRSSRGSRSSWWEFWRK